ncbi:MAG: hypothetical protein VXW43_19810, partial [Pseudomonadota bacterium]|nr:hypothetical protein [Pseudomonadota bacterium]
TTTADATITTAAPVNCLWLPLPWTPCDKSCGGGVSYQPVHVIVDPWLQAQGKSSLRQQWGGDSQIERVTARMLLSMRSGIADYDDEAIKDWTLAHPTQDYTPEMVRAPRLDPGTCGLPLALRSRWPRGP